jgi:hypothetical protein
MIYYGPHTKIDYDHSLFEPVDEIMVMQQHCGGENLIVHKANLKAGGSHFSLFFLYFHLLFNR